MAAAKAQAQLVNTKFGQNRLLYEKEEWFRYESDNFAISFPKDMEDLAAYAIETAEVDYAFLKTRLEYQVRNKIELILYSDYASYLQNNIGLYTKTLNTGGTTRMYSHKVLLYMYMTRYELRRQIREGIAQAIVNRMVYGSNLQEAVQNSVSSPLPKWFAEGMISYSANDWDTEADNELREAFLTSDFNNFNELAKQKPRLAGRSMFHFVEQTHGSTALGNLFYLTRVNRSVESGYLFVFGTSYYAVAANWFNFYKSRYNDDNQERKIPNKGELTLKTHSKSPVGELAISTDGKKVAYAEIHKGEYMVWLHDVASDKAEVVWKGGLRTLTDDVPLNFPRLSFTKNGSKLIIASHEKHKIELRHYDLGNKHLSSPKQVKELDFINFIDAWNGEDIIVSGLKDGQSDLYRITLASGKVEAISTDVYDDFMPTVVKLGGKTGIVFSSIRPEPKFGNPAKDAKRREDLFAKLYFYDLSSRNRQLIQLTDLPISTDYNPVSVDDSTIAFLSDGSGITNRYICRLDTSISHYERQIFLKSGSAVTFHADSSYANKVDTTQIDSQRLNPVFVVKGKSYCNTDYSRSIYAHQTAPSAGKVADLIYYDNKYRIFVRDISPERQESPKYTIYQKHLREIWGVGKTKAELEKSKSITKTTPAPAPDTSKTRTPEQELKIVDKEIERDSAPTRDTSKIDIDNYLFQSEFKDVKNPIKADSLRRLATQKDSIPPQPTILVEGPNGEITKQTPTPRPTPATNTNTLQHRYDPARKTPYRNLFRADALAVQFDNTPLFGNLDMYLGGFYRFTPFSFGMKANFTDIFENYRLEIGMRVPVAFNGFDCYFVLDDRKGRLDKTYSFYRRSRLEDYTLIDTSSGQSQAARGRNIKHLAQFELKYPIDRHQSLRGVIAMQHDQVAIVSQDANSLSVPRYIENRTWLRFEYVFDNAVELSQNIRKGTRFKAYVDFFQPLAIRTDSSFKVDLSGGYTGNIGFDYRKYISLDDKTIFAFRAAGASSFGPQKILYSLGGIENWVFASTDQLIPLPQQDNFAYQTLAAAMRGFANNIRNGASFLVANAELRIPIGSYLDLGSVRSNTLRTFQLVPFFDIGTAWQGLSPFSADNPLNTSVIDRSSAGTVSPIRVRVNYYRQPIIFGFGVGLRAAVSGYFVRADLGFGVETGVLRSPTLQIGIGTDF